MPTAKLNIQKWQINHLFTLGVKQKFTNTHHSFQEQNNKVKHCKRRWNWDKKAKYHIQWGHTKSETKKGNYTNERSVNIKNNMKYIWQVYSNPDQNEKAKICKQNMCSHQQIYKCTSFIPRTLQTKLLQFNDHCFSLMQHIQQYIFHSPIQQYRYWFLIMHISSGVSEENK